MLSFFVFVIMLVILSLSMFVSGAASVANSAPSVPRTTSSLRDYVELGFMPKLDPTVYKVIGITTTNGWNDDLCFNDIVRKANSQMPDGYRIEGLYSIIISSFTDVSTGSQKHIPSSYAFICGATVLLKKE